MKIYAYSQIKGVFTRPTGVAKHITRMFHGLWRSGDVNLSVLAAQDELNETSPLSDLPSTALPFNRRRLEGGWLLLGRPVVDPWCSDADWIYSPMERAIPSCRARLAATVHSLYWFDRDLPLYPRYRMARLKFRPLLRKMVKRCDLLLTVSEFLKRQMVEWFDADPERTIVVGNGAEVEFFEAAQQPLGISGRPTNRPFAVVVSGPNDLDGAPYVLAVARELLKIDRDFQIVVAGHQNEPQYVEQAKELPNIELAGYQASCELAALMHDSAALLFLNRYETFGLGAVEAMAAETPVIGTNFTAVPEIVGGAGVIADVSKPAEIARQLVEVARGGSLREKYIALGRTRARDFTWDTCVKRLHNALSGAR